MKTQNEQPNYGEEYYGCLHDGKNIYNSKEYKEFGYQYLVHYNDMFNELDHQEQKNVLGVD